MIHCRSDDTECETRNNDPDQKQSDSEAVKEIKSKKSKKRKHCDIDNGTELDDDDIYSPPEDTKLAEGMKNLSLSKPQRPPMKKRKIGFNASTNVASSHERDVYENSNHQNQLSDTKPPITDQYTHRNHNHHINNHHINQRQQQMQQKQKDELW